MCRLVSCVLTKTRIFWAHDVEQSHSDIAKRHGLDELLPPDKYVRVEISPANARYDIPLAEWKYNEDQNSFPSWYKVHSNIL